jgi:hypothetical protein
MTGDDDDAFVYDEATGEWISAADAVCEARRGQCQGA